MSKDLTINETLKLYRCPLSKTTITNKIKTGELPEPKLKQRGKINVRLWESKNLPDVGKMIGFLEPIKTDNPIVIVVYITKGGVLKTTTSFNLARIIALNGIPVLVIGQEPQGSITNLLSNFDEPETLEDIKQPAGLYEVFKGEKRIEDVICDTELPTLKFIPENAGLSSLEQEIVSQNKREYVLARILEKVIGKYVIIFDTPSHFGNLVKNAMTMASHVICPFGCDYGSYAAIANNIRDIDRFKQEMDLNWDVMAVRTLLDSNKSLSSDISKQYAEEYAHLITDRSIRRTIKGDESGVMQLSAIEYDPKSPLADDYYEVIKEIWRKVNG